MNRLNQARAWMEERVEGSWAATIEHVLSHEGVFHVSADCVLLGIPCEDAPETLHIIFQCSHLPALRALLCALPYERVRWKRDFRNNYDWHERAVADFCRHSDYGTHLTKPKK